MAATSIPLPSEARTVKLFQRTCFICGSDDSLETHHINGDRNDDSVENRVELCKDCHASIHSARSDDGYNIWRDKLEHTTVRATIQNQLHSELEVLKVETNTPLKSLVPELLRLGIEQKRKQIKADRQ